MGYNAIMRDDQDPLSKEQFLKLQKLAPYKPIFQDVCEIIDCTKEELEKHLDFMGFEYNEYLKEVKNIKRKPTVPRAFSEEMDRKLILMMRWRPAVEDVADFFNTTKERIEKHIRQRHKAKDFIAFRNRHFTHAKNDIFNLVLERAKTSDRMLEMLFKRYFKESDVQSGDITIVYNPKKKAIDAEAKKYLDPVVIDAKES